MSIEEVAALAAQHVNGGRFASGEFYSPEHRARWIEAAEIIRKAVLNEWHPIESLPATFMQPGVFVLLKGGLIVDDFGLSDFPQPTFVVAERHGEFGEWVVAYYDGGHAHVEYREPTHWRTLESISP